MLRVAVPDLVSPSYFPAIAAVHIAGEFGLDAQLDLKFPPQAGAEALADGQIDVLAASAHTPLGVFAGWNGARLLGALSHQTYWFLVVRADLEVARGDLGALSGLTIAAAPGPDQALRAALTETGVDPDAADIRITAPPKDPNAGTSFGLNAANALAAGKIDGFWANGMGARIAVADGVGKVIIDARRGDGPAGLPWYTFAAAAVRTDTLATRHDEVAAFVRALNTAQRRLRADDTFAAQVAQAFFPAREAGLTPELIRADSPWYRLNIDTVQIGRLHQFARSVGLDPADASIDDVVPPWARTWWSTPG